MTYQLAKHLSSILGPLVGNSTYHIRNSADFVQSIKDLRLTRNEIMVSFDVESLFTSVPADEVIKLTYNLHLLDESLSDRTAISPTDIIKLLWLFLPVCVVISVALHDYNLSWYVEHSYYIIIYLIAYVYMSASYSSITFYYRSIVEWGCVRDFVCEIRYYLKRHHYNLRYRKVFFTDIPCTYLLGGCFVATEV